MKKLLVVTIAAVATLALYGVTTVLAQEQAAPEQPVEVVVEGVNYCVLCELAKEEVAGANSAYATMNAVRVVAALDKDNNLMTDLEGTTLHYLPTKQAEPLLVGEQYQGANVTITGLYYKQANVLKVVSFEAEATGMGSVPVGTKSNLQVL